MTLPIQSMSFTRIATSTWILFALLGSSAPSLAETMGLYYDAGTPQIAFAAGDIKTALEKRQHTVQTHDLAALENPGSGKKIILAVAADKAVAAAQEKPALHWPGFRGPGGLGIAPDRHTAFTWNVQTGEGIRWKADVPLPGTGSPIVCGERVFLTGAVEGKGAVYCFDAASGKVLWQREVPLNGKPKFFDEATTFAAPTPITDGQRVYALFLTGLVAAFNLDGTPAWKADLGFPKMNYGYASSPALHGDRLLIQFDQDAEQAGRPALVALDAATGKTLWRTERDMRSSWSSPLVIETPSGPQVVLVSCGGVAAYDPQDGRERWRVAMKQSDVVSSATCAKGLVIAVLASGGALAIRPDGSGDVTKTHVVWRNEDATAEVASPVAVGEWVFLPSAGEYLCLNAADGKKAGSREADADFHASPIVAGGKLYFTSREGEVSILRPDASCEVLAKARLGAKADATPAVAGGCLFFRTEKQLLCIGPADPNAVPPKAVPPAETKVVEGAVPASVPSPPPPPAVSGAPQPTTLARPATDWPCWLGPNGNNQVDTPLKLAEKWPEGGPRLVWTAPFDEDLKPGQSSSSPVVADGMIYFYECVWHDKPLTTWTLTSRNLLRIGFIRDWVTPASFAAIEQARLDPENVARVRKMMDLREKFEQQDRYTEAEIKAMGVESQRIWDGQNNVGAAAKKLAAFKPDAPEELKEEILRAVYTRVWNAAGTEKNPAATPELLDRIAAVREKPFEGEAALKRFLSEIKTPSLVVHNLINDSGMAKKAEAWQTDHLVCLDAATGRKRWRADFAAQAPQCSTAHSKGVNSPTPCVHDGRVFFVGSGQQTFALDAKTGRVLWQVKNDNPPDALVVSSFVIADGKAVVCDSTLRAYDPATGRVLWEQPAVNGGVETLNKSQTTPGVWRHEGKTYLLVNTGAGMAQGLCWCVDAADGRLVWKTPGERSGGDWPSPQVENGILMLRGHYKCGLSAFRIAPGGCEPVWQHDTGDRGSTPLLYQGCVYALGRHNYPGKGRCFDLSTGRVRRETPGRGQQFGGLEGEIDSPIRVNDRLIKGGVMIRATPERFEVVAQCEGLSGAMSTPAFAQGRLYARKDIEIRCYDLNEEGGRK